MDKSIVIVICGIISVIQSCKFIGENGSMCVVVGLTKDELASGGVNDLISSLICDECLFDITDDYVKRLKMKYPNLKRLSMSFNGDDTCTSYTTLLSVRGCKAGKITLTHHSVNI